MTSKKKVSVLNTESFKESMKRCQVHFPWGLAAWPGWEGISFCAGKRTLRFSLRPYLGTMAWWTSLGSLEVVMGYKIGLYDRYNWSDMGPLFQWPKLNWVSLGLFHPEKCWSFGPLATDLGVQKTGFSVFVQILVEQTCAEIDLMVVLS